MADKKKCTVCKKDKPANQFTKTDTIQACIDCKKKAIERSKQYFNK